MPLKDKVKHREYCRLRYYKNREREVKLQRKWSENNREESRRRVKMSIKKHPETKRNEYKRNQDKYRVRQQTRIKYGKLPKGMEYHHITKPYHVDYWLGVDKTEHNMVWR